MTSSSQKPKLIFLWIVPRTCSTALSKCMTFVDDTEVWAEPYMACHFNETFYNPNFRKGDPVADRMRETLKKNEASETMRALRKEMATKIEKSPNLIDQKDISYQWLKEQLEKSDSEKKFIFVKDQSLAINNHFEYLPDVPTHHTFMIRHPREIYPSYKSMTWKRLDFDGTKTWDEWHAADDSPFLPVRDLFQIHRKIWKHFRETSDNEPIIIDGYDLASKPEVILPKYFERLGIPFKKSYLKWDPSQNIIEKKWKGSADMVLMEPKTVVYARAVKSSAFEPPKVPRGTPSNPEWTITPELEEMIDGALPFYEEMFQARLQ
ncbi:hypothetical protein HOLleu_17368 [Holothuria leucospilota]|uniref:Sulfotransferase family protein n=1 Tax=Holothuria leucospilota TaxID=206669 RepID=A0A9Q1C707_HOLLE|nr:hypothetical protein HOLleu_17368 [Holothuria leucospilota]